VPDSVRVVLVTGPKALKYFSDYRRKVAARTITGLGDKAYYDGYASLSVLKGDAYVRIAAVEGNNLTAEEKLASDALPKM
jgi:lipopolysaccharide export system protein LptA